MRRSRSLSGTTIAAEAAAATVCDIGSNRTTATAVATVDSSLRRTRVGAELLFKSAIDVYRLKEYNMRAEPEPHDLRFPNPCSFILAGPTQCGKTTFALNLLRHADQLFQQPSCQQNVVYFYREEQPAYTMFAEEQLVHKWFRHLPSAQEIDDLTEAHLETGSIIIIDDFQEHLTPDTVEIFTNKCHHRNVVIILLAQNIFCPRPGFRTISLNSTFVLLFKNPRDASQIICFAKQFASGSVSWLIEAYREATRNAHSYLLFDTHQLRLDWLRVRSNVLPHELPMKLYIAPEK